MSSTKSNMLVEELSKIRVFLIPGHKVISLFMYAIKCAQFITWIWMLVRKSNYKNRFCSKKL